MAKSVERKRYCIKEYKLKELADIYEVSMYRMRKKLKAIAKVLGKRIGYYYNCTQVKIIFEQVPLPSHIEII
jgi:hypothetical protein